MSLDNPNEKQVTKRQLMTGVAVGIFLLLAIGGAIIIGSMTASTIKERTESNTLLKEQLQQAKDELLTLRDEQTNQDPDSTESSLITELANGQTEPTVVSYGGELDIDWIPVDLQKRSAPLPSFRAALGYFSDDKTHTSDVGNDSFFAGDSYPLGQVRGGAYDGYELTQQTVIFLGMGASFPNFYVLVPSSPLSRSVILDSYPPYDTGLIGATTASNAKSVRKWLTDDFPEGTLDIIAAGTAFETETHIPTFDNVGMFSDDQGNSFSIVNILNRENAISTPKNGKAVRLTGPKAEIETYEREDGSFYYLREDGMMLRLEIALPFMNNRNEMVSDLNFRWTDGSEQTVRMTPGTRGGCGFSHFTSVFTEDDIKPLTKVGDLRNVTTGQFDVPIYRSENLDSAAYTDLMETTYQTEEQKAAGDWRTEQDSVVFVRDGLGRWIRLTNIMVGPQGECGKPVIYLYPETETNIDVRLEPTGGFSATEPTYNNGWRITASPDGQLVDRNDGESYPYLFWEGIGGLYEDPENYWVVAKEDVPSFLHDTLVEIGLVDHEIADFTEFWLPRMEASVYYRIGFHDTETMDRIAPLETTPSPDSVLRILMDFIELDGPEPSNPPTIRPFVRRGFTVVEWGGVLR
ncbi:TPA: hypothetical protein DEP86_00840 [Candidatus Uhrbacteria bacterium]|nr:hypothetical protein [Candidatus Uhrbacteria bacterium]